jgi:hypothetical protein
MLRVLRSEDVQVFGRLDDDSSPERQRQASKKRQGTKSRYAGRGITRFMPSAELRRTGLERGSSRAV